MKNSKFKRLAVVFLPLIGLIALVVRAEILLQSGDPWLLPIEGFDPRDLLRGHYLTFQFTVDHPDPNECYPGQSNCCLCLSHGPNQATQATLRQCSNIREGACEAQLTEFNSGAGLRYYIPENRGPELEKAIRDKKCAMLIRVRKNGKFSIKDLYLDGRPWKEAIK